jgi:hypothetical protein
MSCAWPHPSSSRRVKAAKGGWDKTLHSSPFDHTRTNTNSSLSLHTPLPATSPVRTVWGSTLPYQAATTAAHPRLDDEVVEDPTLPFHTHHSHPLQVIQLPRSSTNITLLAELSSQVVAASFAFSPSPPHLAPHLNRRVNINESSALQLSCSSVRFFPFTSPSRPPSRQESEHRGVLRLTAVVQEWSTRPGPRGRRG